MRCLPTRMFRRYCTGTSLKYRGVDDPWVVELRSWLDGFVEALPAIGISDDDVPF
jgi:hypothetical protein